MYVCRSANFSYEITPAPPYRSEGRGERREGEERGEREQRDIIEREEG